MNRTLTAAVALAAGLGMAGLAHAQVNTSPGTTNPTMSPTTTSPGMTGAPARTQNPATMSAPGAASTYGTSPQANTSQMNQGPQNQNQTNQMGQGTQPASQSQVQQAQQQLKSAGLYRGSIDGVIGPETQTALSQFQREQGLPQSAQLDQQTMSRLINGSNGGNGTGGQNGMSPSSTQITTGGTNNP